MRRRHPNLFLAFMNLAMAYILLGVTIIVTPPRMPPIMPATFIGGIYIVCALCILAGAFESVMLQVSQFGLFIGLIQSVSMSAGLAASYCGSRVPGACVGAVTQSLDRPALYFILGALAVPVLFESYRPGWKRTFE